MTISDGVRSSPWWGCSNLWGAISADRWSWFVRKILGQAHRQPEGRRFEPAKFGDQYEAALVDLINKKRAGQPIAKKDRPAGGNVVDLMEALRRSVGGAEPAKTSKASKKPRKSASGQKEMLMTIEGKKVKDTPKKSASKQQRKSA